jgi:hypothetical protein
MRSETLLESRYLINRLAGAPAKNSRKLWAFCTTGNASQRASKQIPICGAS